MANPSTPNPQRPYENFGFGDGTISTVNRSHADHNIPPSEFDTTKTAVKNIIPQAENEAGPTC